jgi:hypothetical protein
LVEGPEEALRDGRWLLMSNRHQSLLTRKHRKWSETLHTKQTKAEEEGAMSLSNASQSWCMPDELWEQVKPLLPPRKPHPL